MTQALTIREWLAKQAARRLPPGPGGVPRPVLWVSSLAYLSVLLAGAYYRLAALGGRPGADWLIGFAGILPGLLGLERLGAGASRRRALALLLARMLAFEAVAAADPSGFSRILYLLIPFNAYFCLGAPASYGLGLLYAAGYAARLQLLVPGWTVSREHLAGLLMFAIGLILTIAMARVAAAAEASRGRAEQLLADLTASHRQLAAYAGQAAGLAAAEERNRLARDIHDSLGHHLTAISVQLEKAVAFRERAPGEADQAIRDAHGAARLALREVRQSVGALRLPEEPFSLADALAGLCRRLESERLALRLQVSGDERGAARPGLQALYHAAQEALTNVQRHAGASRALLRLEFGERDIRLAVEDDGRGFDPALLDRLPAGRREHFGLQGMRERLALAGGSLDLRRGPDGGMALLCAVPRDQRRAAGEIQP